MNISGIQKLTLLDYPGKLAATVFSPGCNLRCPFCQNKLLVLGEEQPDGTRVFPLLPPHEFDQFQDSRTGLLDGICLTGGEPLLQDDIADCCAAIHAHGLLVKLDTNGTLPDRLERLLDAGLVDYVAMDMKNVPARYAETVGRADFDFGIIRRSLDALRRSGIPYELRTTVMRELHTADNLLELASMLSDDPAWYLQQFRESAGIIAGTGVFHAWSASDMRKLLPRLQDACPAARLRGFD